jgi:tRNA A58 N-methylase Trm61
LGYSIITENYWLLLIPASFFCVVIYFTLIIRRDAAYVPTPENIVRRMLELTEVKPGETVYDLGSGDGRILIIAAREFGAKAVGIEIDRGLVTTSLKRIKEEKLEDRVQIIRGDFFVADLRNADVVTLYLRQDTNDKLAKKLKNELRPGARVASYTFVMSDWIPAKIDKEAKVYVYTI